MVGPAIMGAATRQDTGLAPRTGAAHEWQKVACVGWRAASHFVNGGGTTGARLLKSGW